jgi:hypothetical protein
MLQNNLIVVRHQGQWRNQILVPTVTIFSLLEKLQKVCFE